MIKKYFKDKGAALMLALITFFVVLGISGSFLMISSTSYNQTKYSTLKLQSYNIALGGIENALMKLKNLNEDNELPTYEDAIEKSSNNPSWAQLDEFKDGNWGKYPKWLKFSFKEGECIVDLYIDESEEYYCVWAVSNYHNVKSEIISFYHLVSETPPIDFGAISFQADPDGNLNNDKILISFHGNRAKISGWNHNEDGTLKNDFENGAVPALTTNLSIPFGLTNSKPPHNTGDSWVEGPAVSPNLDPSSQQSGIEGVKEFLDKLIEYARENADIDIESLAKGNGNGNRCKIKLIGNTQIGSRNDYKIVYLNLENGKSLHISGHVEGYGILIIETNVDNNLEADESKLGEIEENSDSGEGTGDPNNNGRRGRGRWKESEQNEDTNQSTGSDSSQTSEDIVITKVLLNITGRMTWHGLILVYINNKVLLNGHPCPHRGNLAFVRGRPTIIGALGFYIAAPYEFNGGTLIDVRGRPQILWSTDVWDKVINKIKTLQVKKDFKLVSWKNRQ